ncbi:MAG TPA: hypothetical protein VLY04_10480 [Bryobacteraceae bacterium]|nr:hypothetical protein [Bryobacteraceae bacterium]
MKKLMSSTAVLLAIGLVALTGAAVPASAQVTRMRTNIPFAFYAAERMLPAGDYSLAMNIQTRVLTLEPVGTTERYAVLLSPGTDTRKGDDLSNGMLRFTRYDDKIVLSAVWRPDWDQGNRVPMPKVMAEYARTHSGAAAAAMDVVVK